MLLLNTMLHNEKIEAPIIGPKKYPVPPIKVAARMLKVSRRLNTSAETNSYLITNKVPAIPAVNPEKQKERYLTI